MLPRFLVPDLKPGNGTAVVTGGEAHHLTRVLRLGVGDEVAVFDGRGREFRARVDRVTGGSVTVVLGEPIEPAAERAVPVTLAQAVLKGTSMDEVVRDAAMMGVVRIVPLVTAHTVARRAASADGAERWRRVAVASVKQCRRARVPEIRDPVPFSTWRQEELTGLRLLLVEPAIRGVEPRPLRSLLSLPAPSSVTLAIGPEGGWAAEEVTDAVRERFVPVTLGQLTLRAEAVALTALGGLGVVWD